MTTSCSGLVFGILQLTGRIPGKIGDMKSLQSFDVSLNGLFGELPVSLSSLSFLSSFNVSYSNLMGRIPSSTHSFKASMSLASSATNCVEIHSLSDVESKCLTETMKKAMNHMMEWIGAW